MLHFFDKFVFLSEYVESAYYEVTPQIGGGCSMELCITASLLAWIYPYCITRAIYQEKNYHMYFTVVSCILNCLITGCLIIAVLILTL